MTNRRAWTWVAGIFIGIGIVGGFIGASCSGPRSATSRGFTAGFKNAFLSHFGMSSPGGKAVAKAGKCQNASVVAGEDIGDVGDSGILDMDFVICILPAIGDIPDCDDLARAFLLATGTARNFMVEVRRLTNSTMLCERTYDRSGKLLIDYLKK